MRITRSKHLNLCIGQSRFVYILARSNGRFARHNLRSELLLALYELIEVGIKCFFCNETVNVYFGIFVTLTDTTTKSLLQVRRSPRAVKVARCRKFILHVSTCTHLLSAAHKDTDITSANLLKEFKFLCFGVCFVNEFYFFGGYSTLYELLANVIIHGEITVILRGG